MKHIVEQTVVPQNPSTNSIINKEKYNLYAPVARKGRPGIAAYNVDDFEIRGSTVSLNPRIRTVVEEADLKTAYDHVINTPEALASLESLSGRVLVRDVTLTNSVALTVGVNVCLLTLYNVVIPDEAVLNLTGHWYCSINCVGEQRGHIILRGFKGVKDFNPAEGALVLYGCHSISNCTISEAEDCYHIDNCWAVSDDPTFYNCYFICGISFADSTEGTVEFDFCSYLSNIDCEGRYVECTFVDDTTCKGFVSPEDVGKVRAITTDGSYVPIVPTQGGGGENTPTKVSELENDVGYITSAEAPVQSVNGKKGAVSLTAEDIGADKSGAAVTKVAEHNVDDESHQDVRLLIAGLADRLNALANSDDTTLDQMKEVVDYIKSNRGLIEQITTNKISYTDIVDNLTTNAAKKPLSAAQGVVLKALIDAITVPTKVSELANDKGYLTSYTESDPTVPSWAKQSSKPSYTKTEVGLGNVDNVRQYSAENPPPYPVESVNGNTGEIVLNASDVGARPNTWMPTAAEVGARPNTWTPTYSEVGADKNGAASEAVSEHNVDDEAHNDIRLELKALAERINAVLDSDDTTLDELSEIVAYIKSNKSLIELVTSTKVGYGDIVDNLTTNSTKNVLSASQGVALKRLIDALSTDKLDSSALPTAIDTALAQAKESGEFDGADGERGNGILSITTAPASYTTTTGGFTPVYRIALSTVISQSKVSKVLVGDTLAYSYYHYPVGYVDASYVYLATRKNIRGAAGTNGTSITIASVNESDESGGTNTVNFSDGKSLTVKNGRDGANGEDYVLTETDKTEIAGIVTGDNLPDYWEEYLPDKIAAIKALQDEGGKDCFSFIVIADIHYDTNLGKRSPAVAKRILDKCDIRFVLAVGDFQNRAVISTKEETEAEWGDIRAMLAPINESVLMQKGNHDGSWGISNGTAYAYNFTPAELYNRVYALTYKHQNAVTDESGTAYYVDDTARKIRFIMLNTTCNLYEEENGIPKYNNMTHARLTQVQFDFLTKNALVTVPDDDWSVLLAGHHPLWEAELKDAGVLLGVLGAYKSKGTYTGEYAGTAEGGAAYTNLATPNDVGTTSDSPKWLNDYRIASTEIQGGNTGKSVSNVIPITFGDVIRIKGATISTSDRHLLLGTGTNGSPLTLRGNNGGNITAGVIDYLTYKGNTDGIYTYEVTSNTEGHTPTGYRFTLATPTNPDDVIITVNQPITTDFGYDYVSVNCDFSVAKGTLVGYFSGHNHTDMAQVLSGIRQVITRCDANEENDKHNTDGSVNTNGLWYQRQQAIANGDEIQEQSFNVFTVNKHLKRIYATKIGAGEDFGGDDAPITY